MRKLRFFRLVSWPLLIALSGLFLWEFVMIWVYGEITFNEPNIAIRAVETVMLAGFVLFSLTGYILEIKHWGG